MQVVTVCQHLPLREVLHEIYLLGYNATAVAPPWPALALLRYRDALPAET